MIWVAGWWQFRRQMMIFSAAQALPGLEVGDEESLMLAVHCGIML
jgi:hypothetical protein